MSKTKGFRLAVAAAVAMVFTSSAFAQGMDTAYVPFSSLNIKKGEYNV